jgi:hypothetical protein
MIAPIVAFKGLFLGVNVHDPDSYGRIETDSVGVFLEIEFQEKNTARSVLIRPKESGSCTFTPRNKPLKATMGALISKSRRLPSIPLTTCRRDFRSIAYNNFFTFHSIVLMIAIKEAAFTSLTNGGVNKKKVPKESYFLLAALVPLQSGRTEEM